jgi:hypothetical protein
MTASPDPRPTQCRQRLREEGKMYPRSACWACKTNIFTRLFCPYDSPVTVDQEEQE